jgi:hypothetical protein
LRSAQIPDRVYVIMRVFDITTRDVNHRIFVNPLEVNSRYLELEAQAWYGYAV